MGLRCRVYRLGFQFKVRSWIESFGCVVSRIETEILGFEVFLGRRVYRVRVWQFPTKEQLITAPPRFSVFLFGGLVCVTIMGI